MTTEVQEAADTSGGISKPCYIHGVSRSRLKIVLHGNLSGNLGAALRPMRDLPETNAEIYY